LDLVEIALQIMQASGKRPPLGVADLAHLFRAGAHPLAVFFIVYLFSRHAQYLEAARQTARAGQAEEGRNKLSCSEIAQRPEDHDDAGIGLRQRESGYWKWRRFDNYVHGLTSQIKWQSLRRPDPDFVQMAH